MCCGRSAAQEKIIREEAVAAQGRRAKQKSQSSTQVFQSLSLSLSLSPLCFFFSKIHLTWAVISLSQCGGAVFVDFALCFPVSESLSFDFDCVLALCRGLVS